MKFGDYLIESTLAQYKKQIKSQGIYLSIYPGSMGSNWDGTWWTAKWSDGNTDQVTITAYKKFDGLSYCRSQAIKKAYITRAEAEGIKLS